MVARLFGSSCVLAGKLAVVLGGSKRNNVFFVFEILGIDFYGAQY